MDASALVKAFVRELGTDMVIGTVAGATVSATSRISYVECRAAFARASCEGRITTNEERRACRLFDEAWLRLAVVEIDHDLATRAAELCREHAIRAADAIHLASSLVLAGGSLAGTEFACFDRRLWEAATALGFTTIPETKP